MLLSTSEVPAASPGNERERETILDGVGGGFSWVCGREALERLLLDLCDNFVWVEGVQQSHCVDILLRMPPAGFRCVGAFCASKPVSFT